MSKMNVSELVQNRFFIDTCEMHWHGSPIGNKIIHQVRIIFSYQRCKQAHTTEYQEKLGHRKTQLAFR